MAAVGSQIRRLGANLVCGSKSSSSGLDTESLMMVWYGSMVGKTVWYPCCTLATLERFRDRAYINSHSLLYLLLHGLWGRKVGVVSFIWLKFCTAATCASEIRNWQQAFFLSLFISFVRSFVLSFFSSDNDVASRDCDTCPVPPCTATPI